MTGSAQEEEEPTSRVSIVYKSKTVAGVTRAALFASGVQNWPPQNVSLWPVDYSELKAMENLCAQEKLLPFLKPVKFKLGIFPEKAQLPEINFI